MYDYIDLCNEISFKRKRMHVQLGVCLNENFIMHKDCVFENESLLKFKVLL